MTLTRPAILPVSITQFGQPMLFVLLHGATYRRTPIRLGR